MNIVAFVAAASLSGCIQIEPIPQGLEFQGFDDVGILPIKNGFR